jgi:hypothetical protein
MVREMAVAVPSPAPIIEIFATALGAPSFHCVVCRDGAWDLIWRLRATYPSVSWQARRGALPAEIPSGVLRRLPRACRTAQAGMPAWVDDLVTTARDRPLNEQHAVRLDEDETARALASLLIPEAWDAGSRVMTDLSGVIRAARVAGKRGDRAALISAARAWVDAEARDGVWWAGAGRIGDCRFDGTEAGMLMIAGRGPATSDAIAKRLLWVDANADGSDRVRVLASAPLSELDNYALSKLAWLRLIGTDWRPVPPARPRQGRLSRVGKRNDSVARTVLAAFSARDRVAIAAAIGTAEAFENSRRFSLFGFALAEEARRIGIDLGIAAYAF